MSIHTVFNFFAYDRDNPVCKNDEFWDRYLPSSPDNAHTENAYITYGHYYLLVKSFLEKDDCQMLRKLLVAVDFDISTLSDINVNITVFKHGEFYHPSHLEISANGRLVSYVINLAVSPAGKEIIKTEFDVFKKLMRFSNDIPVMYIRGEARLEDKVEAFLMIGEWLQNYHEFHISLDENGNYKTIVWNDKDGIYYLNRSAEYDAYKKIAGILTNLYRVDTGEQVYPWHHAAGDFILRLHDDQADVKLITVRQYSSLIEQSDDPEFYLFSLLIFLINMSIRIRLDRLDGTGETVWLDDYTVEAAVEGFWDALTLKIENKIFTESMFRDFKSYLAEYNADDILDIAEMIVGAYNQNASEVSEIRKSLETHCKFLHGEIMEKI